MQHFRFEERGTENPHPRRICGYQGHPRSSSLTGFRACAECHQKAIENKRRACGLSLGSCGSATTTCSPLPYCRGANGLINCSLCGAATNFLYQEDVEFCSTGGRCSGSGATRGRAVKSCAKAAPAVIVRLAQTVIRKFLIELRR